MYIFLIFILFVGSNLTVTTNQQKPCESAHDITLKLGGSDDIKPLTISILIHLQLTKSTLRCIVGIALSS